MRELWNIFWVYARIGSMTFGGGYAMLPILQREVVDRRGWSDEQTIADYYAIGQCIPGVISVNAAIFLGVDRKGIPGGIAAGMGVVFPSLVVITAIAAFLQSFIEYPAVQDAFAGVSVCICILILNTVCRLWKKSVINKGAFFIFAVVFGGSMAGELLGHAISPILMVIFGAVAGVVLGAFERKSAGGGGQS